MQVGVLVGKIQWVGIVGVRGAARTGRQKVVSSWMCMCAAVIADVSTAMSSWVDRLVGVELAACRGARSGREILMGEGLSSGRSARLALLDEGLCSSSGRCRAVD